MNQVDQTLLQTRSCRALLWLGAAGLIASCGGRSGIDLAAQTSSSSGSNSSSSSGGNAQSSSSSGSGAGGSGIDCASCQSLNAEGSLEFGAIDEASGLAASRQHDDVFYLHNDSGDSPRVFMMNQLGAHLGVLSLQGNVQAVDWEDMAVGPCPSGNGSCIYLGDIGDNPESRSSYQLYVFAEPDQVEDGTITAFTRYDFNYPDGSHNAEAMLVGSDGGVTIVSKVSSGQSRIYQLKLDQTTVTEVSFSGEMSPPIGIAMFTGGDVHPQGNGVLLRTYTNLFYYPPIDGNMAATLQGKPCAMQITPEGQGEAVAWTASGNGFITVSEGSGSKVHRYGCAQ